MTDYVLTCTGGLPTPLNFPVPTLDFKVVLNTELTSRLMDTSVNGSEVLLIVDEPAAGQQNICLAKDAPCPMLGEDSTGTSSYLPANGNSNKNVFQGKWDSSHPGTITFPGVPVDPPGNATRIFRITNVRANATQLAGGNAIYMTVSVSSPPAMPINNPQQIVAYVFNGLIQNQDGAISFAPSTGVNVNSGTLQFQGAAGDFVHNVGFAGFVKAGEDLPSTFRVRNTATSPATPLALSDQDVPGATPPGVETGFFNSTDFAGTEAATAGLADSGTRVKVKFANVPAGVHVYVPLKITSGALEGDLVANEAGPYTPASASSFDPNGLLGEVVLNSGAGAAIYEIVSEDPANVEELDVPVIVAFIANAPAAGTATAGVTFAPNTTPPDFAAESSGTPIPRFLDTGAPASRFCIGACAAAAPAIALKRQTLIFNFQIHGSAAPSQTISVGTTSPTSGVAFNASLGPGCSWLSLDNTSGVTPANLKVSIDPTMLEPSTYNCAISINAASASNSPQTVQVYVMVAGPANATDFQCRTSAPGPNQARLQGITEVMGDFVFTCTGGTPTALNVPVGTVDIQVALTGTGITSRLLDTSVNGSEALLLVDEPPPGFQNVCLAQDAPCSMLGEGNTIASSYLPANGNNNKNVFQGKWDPSQPNIITFAGIPIDPPGAARGFLVFRITNVRANASNFSLPGSGIGGMPIPMTIMVNNAGALPINSPQQQFVGFVFNGLVQKQDSPATFSQCAGVNARPGKLQFQGTAGDFVHNAGFAGFVKAAEGFGSAFKIRNIATTPAAPLALSDQNVPGTGYPAVDTDFFSSTDFAGTEAVTAGLADSGTRVKVEFKSVPAGVHVYVPLKIAAGFLEAHLVANEIGPYAPAPASAFDPNGMLGEVALSNGAGAAVYEIVSEDPANPEELDVPVIIAYAANSTGTGTATAAVTFAPNTVPADFAAESSSVPVPRFVDSSTPVSRFSINSCAVAAPAISASPNALSFSYQIGGNAPPDQVISVASTNPSSGMSFNASLGAGCSWLTLNSTSGVTPANLTASAHPNALGPSTYHCPISISAASATNSPQVVQASLTVTRAATPPPGPALIVSPGALVFNTPSASQQPSPQTIAVFSSGVSLSFSAVASTATGGNWLSLSPSSGTTPSTLGVTVNPAGLAPGVYQGAVTINCASAAPESESIAVTLNVANAPAQPASPAGSEQLTFSFVAGSHQAQWRHVSIGGPSSYHASADAPWLSVTPADGTASATAPALLTISADPTGLGPGTYTGRVTVNGLQTGDVFKAFVTMTISESTQSIVLSQTGLSFRAASTAGGIALTQPLSILRGGTGTLNWSLTASTLGGGNWLSASSTSGSTGDSPSQVNIQVATAGLVLGDYYGQLRVEAPGAANSPQFVDVVLTVAAFDDVSAMVDPIGLLLVDGPNLASPSARSVKITNRTGSSLSFESSAYFYGGGAWFTAQPQAGSVGPGQTQPIVIQTNAAGLQTGTDYQGELNLNFSDHSTQKVTLLLVAASARPATAGLQKAAVGCAPANIIPLITSLGGESTLSIGRPAAIQVQAVDNCGGVPQGNGSLELQFSNGDPPVPLTPLPEGTWAGTFTPETATTGNLQISVQGGFGSAQSLPNTLPVTLTRSSTEPLVAPMGISSAASYSASAIAPGSLINIYGDHLAGSSSEFSSYPLLAELSGTEVRLAGKAMPLISVSEDRIIAQVPYEIGFNTSQQLVVRNGTTQSAPQMVPVAPAQPAVFTVNQQGTGQAVATVGNSATLADANHPVKAGDVIVIYCAGLGAVTPPVASGAAAPVNPLSRTATPAVTVGGQPALVQFSGLTPGYAGLYQINAVVPAGVTAGDEVPVVVTIAGQTSPPVTIAVR